jgi:hypothetical protein
MTTLMLTILPVYEYKKVGMNLAAAATTVSKRNKIKTVKQ